MSQRQLTKLKQQQKLTPQQIMLMKYLQMPVSDLEQSIKDELEKNPLLEDTGSREEAIQETEDDFDEDEQFFDDDFRSTEHFEKDKNSDFRQTLITSESSATDWLLEQVGYKNLTERQTIICRELIGSIDDNGYLCRDLALISNDLAFRQGLECSIDEIEKVLHVIQSLEPAGVGARNLQECLSIQLHRDELTDEAKDDATLIIDHAFDLFSKRHFDKLKEKTGLDEQRLDAAIKLIQRLDPKPSPNASSTSRNSQYILPDFIISNHDGHLFISSNDRNLPELQINEYYKDMMLQMQASGKKSQETQATIQFLKSKNDEAQNFIEMLRQRNKTLSDIVSYIVKKQSRFFVTGNPCDLRPLQQKDVAASTGYDTSTISRVVNSKYLRTDFGTISLKECFSKSIANQDGEQIGVEQIKSAIQNLINNEDRQKPLTDDEITNELKAQGFPLARRTVAKYREMLGIPVGRMRRGLKIIFLFLFCTSFFTLYAQQPTYYDSLINAQLKKQDTQKPATTKKQDKNNRKKTVIDSTLLKGDELINIIYDSCTPNCARLWYGNHFSANRVREYTLPWDSLPDEINIKLVQKAEDFCFPVKNIITSPYGWRWERPHRGVDIRLNVGCPVHAAFAGIVRIARPMGAYGNLVVIRHYNGLETVYGHLSKINVKPQQNVNAGDVIGLGGSTGHSTGPHLHFEVRFQYETFDPEWILNFSDYTLRTRKLHLDKTYFGVTKPHKHEQISYKADQSFIKETAEPPKERYYTVQKDDYLELIAMKFGITVQKLKELNPDIKKAKKGMRLRVK